SNGAMWDWGDKPSNKMAKLARIAAKSEETPMVGVVWSGLGSRDFFFDGAIFARIKAPRGAGQGFATRRPRMLVRLGLRTIHIPYRSRNESDRCCSRGERNGRNRSWRGESVV